MNLLHVILVVSCVYGSVRAGNDLNDLDPHHHDEETHTSSTTEKHVNHREEEPHLPSYQFLRSGRGNPNPNNQKPIKPQSPDCGMYFPGTPAWNDCFRKFMQSMANFQGQVHEFNKNKVQVGSSTWVSKKKKVIKRSHDFLKILTKLRLNFFFTYQPTREHVLQHLVWFILQLAVHLSSRRLHDPGGQPAHLHVHRERNAEDNPADVFR